jgi:tetratricopeptide (TPR) repeat protein
MSGGVWGMSVQETAWFEARKLLNKALELDPNNAFVYDRLAVGYHYYEWDFKQADDYFNLEKQMTGIDGHWSPDFYLKMGSFVKALAIIEGSIERDPLPSWNYFLKAQALYFLGRKTEAIQILDEANRRFDDFLLKRKCVKLYYLYGETDKFLAAHKKLITNFDEDRPPLILWLEVVHALHEGQDTQVFIDQMQEIYSNNPAGSPAWFIALSYAVLGHDEALFEWLEKSYERGETEMTWLKIDPVLDPYKTDPRYLDLLRRMNFPENGEMVFQLD